MYSDELTFIFLFNADILTAHKSSDKNEIVLFVGIKIHQE